MADKPHQFQMAFVAEQDRMLLRIGTCNKAEYRLWLTRRVVRSLWEALLKIVEAGQAKNTPIEPEKREAILQFEHQSAVEQADFKTPFEEAADSYPLGEDGVLVSSISGGRKENGVYVLKLGSSQGKAITFNIDDRLMHSFMQMLIESSKLAEWGLQLRLPVSDSSSSTDVSSPPGKVMRH